MLGMVSGMVAVLPTAIYAQVVLAKDDDDKTILANDHKTYTLFWYIFTGSHIAMFMPVVSYWSLLQTGATESTGFFELWLGKIVAPWVTELMVGVELMWIFEVWFAQGKEDEAYTLLVPIMIVIFYPLIALGTIYMFICDWWKAIKYYDPEVIQAFLEYTKREEEKEASANETLKEEQEEDENNENSESIQNNENSEEAAAT